MSNNNEIEHGEENIYHLNDIIRQSGEHDRASEFNEDQLCYVLEVTLQNYVLIIMKIKKPKSKITDYN